MKGINPHQLGTGKTLALTYLAWTNWRNKGRKIYSNYNLYGFPFTKVNSIPDLDLMKEGFFAGDELWLWLSSWAGRSKEQEIISSILLKSRKRGITIAYTSQSIHQVNKRIRDVTDFISYPLMSLDNSYCRLEVFRGPNPRMESRIKPPIYFNCEPVFAMFNTYEEIRQIVGKEEENDFREILLPVSSNSGFIRYLQEKKGITDPLRIKKICDDVERIINPEKIGVEKSEHS